MSSTGFNKGISGDFGASVDMAPYKALFADQNKMALAQAKESAGNLTGSGFGNILGDAAGRQATAQGSFLANLLMQQRNQNSQKFLSAAGLVPNLTGQEGYQPGFLDYLFQGTQAAAPIIAKAVGK